MFSVDGFALDNPAMGWEFQAASRPLSDFSNRLTDLDAPGVPGVVAGIPSALTYPTPAFVVDTPRVNLDALLSLWMYGSKLTVTSVGSRQAVYEFVSSSMERFQTPDERFRVTVTVRIPGVFWRDVATSTVSAALGSASVAVNAWSGMSGVTPDAIIRVRGPVNGLQVTSGLSWVTYPDALTASQWFRFHTDTGKAYVTATDAWSGGSNVTGVTQFDGPGGKFSVVPVFTSPASRYGRVTVTTTSRGTGATAWLRGRGAYLV